MASRTDVVLVRSEVLDSIKDLTGQWNDNDYQRLRVRKVLTIVDRFFLSGEPLIFEQRALVDVFSGLSGILVKTLARILSRARKRPKELLTEDQAKRTAKSYSAFSIC